MYDQHEFQPVPTSEPVNTWQDTAKGQQQQQVFVVPQYGYPVQSTNGPVYVVAESFPQTSVLETSSDPNLPHGVAMLFCILSFFLTPFIMLIPTLILLFVTCKEYEPRRNLRAIGADLVLHLIVVVIWICILSSFVFLDPEMALSFLILFLYAPNLFLLSAMYLRAKKSIRQQEMLWTVSNGPVFM